MSFSHLGSVQSIRQVALENPVNEAPIAEIATTPMMGQAPLVVVYGGSHSFDPDGTIVTYDWDFGDGSRANGEIVSHVFTQAGTYTTVLTVVDNAGETATAEVVITVDVGPQTELILNNGFEEVDVSGLPLDWKLGATQAWQIDTLDPLDGARSLYLSRADLARRTPIASATTLTLTPGHYTFGAWIATESLGPDQSRTRGVRLALRDESITTGSRNIASTPIIRGTTSVQWVGAEVDIVATGRYTLRVQTYNRPAGEAWIDGVSLIKQ